MGGSGQALAMRNYSGGIRIQNKTGPEDVSLDLDPGDVFLSASVGGAGTIKIRGVGTVTNEGATATVEDHHLLNHDAIWSHVVDGPYTAEQILRVLLAAQAGKLSGADTGNIAIRDASDTKDRITATTDANGNRTSVTIDAT